MHDDEQAAQSLINQIALHSWSYGVDDDPGQTDNVALLITILDEFPALLGTDERDSCIDGNGDGNGDIECCYVHLTSDFGRWIQHVRRVWYAREVNGTVSESSASPSMTLTPRPHPSALNSAPSSSSSSILNHDTNTSAYNYNHTINNTNNHTIGPMPSLWHTSLVTLSRKIDILNQSINELDAAPEGSTLALVLQRCAAFLANARREIDEMKEMEALVVGLEMEVDMGC